MTLNIRSWRNFFSLRADKAAHPQMREIAYPMLKAFHEYIPVVFDDLYEEKCEDKSYFELHIIYLKLLYTYTF